MKVALRVIGRGAFGEGWYLGRRDDGAECLVNAEREATIFPSFLDASAFIIKRAWEKPTSERLAAWPVGDVIE
jgi:hypothetical protein